MDLERINYRDCIPLLNEILLEPDIDRRNQYNSTIDYQGHLLGTCSITLLPRFAEANDVFWGYQVAIAAATAIKSCVEDSVDRYGGIAFTTRRRLFYAQVRSVGEGGVGEVTSLPISVESGFAGNLLLPAVNNNTNATLITPDPTSAIPACQISKFMTHHLFPVNILDCYYLFYNILTNPTVERPVILRGLSPIRYERYGTCSLQLRGHSALSADTITYVALLLGAVAIVQKCVVESGFLLAGAVGPLHDMVFQDRIAHMKVPITYSTFGFGIIIPLKVATSRSNSDFRVLFKDTSDVLFIPIKKQMFDVGCLGLQACERVG
ncbi:MAG: hypothetical protein ASARMPRED_008174 [Alectoria sarmentosa]|nr:MAG: hypothetical protein ASARMPRED_008174 [Alectoria sarmentosa]